MIEKRKDGWRAEDQFPFDGPRRLAVKTYKINGYLVTHAAVNSYYPGGYEHAYGLGAGGDFGKYVFRIPGGRATEKTVAAQHAQALAMVPQLIEEARAHYAQTIAA